MAYRRRRGRSTRSPVTQSNCTLKRATKCRGCGQEMMAGDVATRLRLKKSYQQPCGCCNHKPPKLKLFHPHCVPGDIQAAMGLGTAQAGPSASTTNAAPGAAAPPPPKPVTPDEALLAAVSAFEHALLVRVRAAGKRALTPELQSKFKTFQSIKARILRPGTPAEGEVATTVGLKRLIDMIGELP